VRRNDPDGRLLASVGPPARKPTMPAFGGSAQLFVAAAPDADPPGGGLYLLDPRVAGLAIPSFDPQA